MTAVAEMLGSDAVDRLAALKAELGQRERQGAEPVNVRPRVTSAPVCGACGQPVPAVERPLPGCTAAPAAVFRSGAEHLQRTDE